MVFNNRISKLRGLFKSLMVQDVQTACLQVNHARSQITEKFTLESTNRKLDNGHCSEQDG